jgi:hypothetical protein
VSWGCGLYKQHSFFARWLCHTGCHREPGRQEAETVPVPFCWLPVPARVAQQQLFPAAVFDSRSSRLAFSSFFSLFQNQPFAPSKAPPKRSVSQPTRSLKYQYQLAQGPSMEVWFSPKPLGPDKPRSCSMFPTTGWELLPTFALLPISFVPCFQFKSSDINLTNSYIKFSLLT